MSLRRLALVSAACALSVLAACVPRPAPPEPAPPPPSPAPAPPPEPAPPAPAEWEDAPATPGDWRLSGRSAAFGSSTQGAQFVLRCEDGRQISLVRSEARGGAALVIRTTYGARALPATAQPDGLAARLSAMDPLLDAIVFSRGRFAVEAEGLPRLIIPAWPEPARVVEDCRA